MTSSYPNTPNETHPQPTPDLWSKSGVFAQRFPDYEPRPQQQQMFEAVHDALSHNQHLIVEAGTGTGKSMAYLTSIMLLSAQDPNLRFVVSTNTINLQQQLVKKDIPQTLAALEEAGLIPVGQFKYTTLKGRNNYLCQQNFESFRQTNAGRGWIHAEELIENVEAWETETGDRAELNLGPEHAGPWGMISANHNSACPFYQSKEQDNNPCFLRKVRRAAQNANLVVANHALFLADLANSEPQLGHTTHLIIDESHHLEEEAGQQFGWELSEEDLKNVAQILKEDPVLGQLNSEMLRAWHRYWTSMAHCVPEPRYREDTNTVPIDRKLRESYDWHTATEDAQAMEEAVEQLLRAIASENTRAVASQDPHRETVLRPVQETLNDVRKRVSELMAGSDHTYVQWMERSLSRGTIAKCIPLNVAPILANRLFARKTATVLTSATLATQRDDFSLIRSRIGFPETGEELALDSPFDYRKQARFMSPIDIPTPNEPEFNDSVAECIELLGLELQGHTLALFTSHAALNGTAKRIREPLSKHGIAVLAQGRDGTPAQIIEEFRNRPKAVVLGTASFWEGIDLSQDVLKAVVICRLPFPVPTDPVIKARSNTFTDAFSQYQTPIAILRFRQGCGRLIRNRNSKGSIVVLDSRIRNKNYGMKFFSSLPKCAATKSFMHNVGKLAREWVQQ